MKALIVSCFEWYEKRIQFIENALKKEEYQVEIILSDFCHFDKDYRKPKEAGFTYLHVPQYKKNVSIKRLYSHMIFSCRVYKHIKQESYNLIYVLIPPNFLCYFLHAYKKQVPSTKIIFDVIDMWPESMPIPKNLRRIACFPFWIWSGLRNYHLKCTDAIVFECKRYKDKLKAYQKGRKSKIIYLAYKHSAIPKLSQRPDIKETIHICYLGSINHIIHLSLIVQVLEEIKRYQKVELHLIGKGERCQELIESVKRKGIKIHYYGAVFDEKKKVDIMQKCHFGLNLMCDICVGLSTKSIDYFAAGLPVINNLLGDSSAIIQKEGAGFNITENNFKKIIRGISQISQTDFLKLSKRAYLVYQKYFSEKKVEQQFSALIRSVKNSE